MALDRKTLGSIAIELLVNIALPYLIYVKAEAPIGQWAPATGAASWRR